MRKLLLILSLMVCLGCDANFSSTPKINYYKDQYKTEIAANIVKQHIASPDIVTITQKHKRSECPECKGSGILKSGDGLSTIECPYCEKDKQAINTNITPFKCCGNCICGLSCDCSYPGECLIKKNNGWPVKLCDEDKCTIYYPRDLNGNEYNPYDLIPKIKQNEYKDYKYPLSVDKNGNQIK